MVMAATSPNSTKFGKRWLSTRRAAASVSLENVATHSHTDNNRGWKMSQKLPTPSNRDTPMARTRFEPKPMSLVPSMVEHGGGPLKLPETALALLSEVVVGGLTRGCFLGVGAGAGVAGDEVLPCAGFGTRGLPPALLGGAREEDEADDEAGGGETGEITSASGGEGGARP